MSRRAGQIRRKGDRKWLVGVFLGRDGSGKRSYKSRTVQGTKKDAEKVLREMLGKRDEGLIQPTRLSPNAFLDDWLSRGAQRWGPRTHQDREYLLQRHVRPRLGTRWLDSITALDLQRFYDRLQQDGASPDRLRRLHAIVRAALRTAVRRRLIPTAPRRG
jgi:integrase